jgi:putative ABC transport system substrate-binding protein
MDRRRFLLTSLAGVFASPLGGKAQTPEGLPRIGYLSPASAGMAVDVKFRETLHELGYIDGRNVVIEERFANGRPDRLLMLARELVGLKVSVIVAVALPAIQAAREVTTAIPIVMAFSSDDPVKRGLVVSLARPGGNVTGLTILVSDLSVKWLELATEAVPGTSPVGVLVNPDSPQGADQLMAVRGGARSLGVQLHEEWARGTDQNVPAFTAMAKARTRVVVVLSDPVFFRDHARIVELALKNRLPAVHIWREFAEVGGFMSYGPNTKDMASRAAGYVARILRGGRPADMPVEQPTKFELVINLKTAKALGLTIPPSLLARADQVIE